MLCKKHRYKKEQRKKKRKVVKGTLTKEIASDK